MDMQRIRIVTPRFTKYDDVIKNFLHYGSNFVNVECENAETTSKALQLRIKWQKLQNLHVHLLGGKCYLEADTKEDKIKALQRYDEINNTRMEMQVLAKERLKAYIRKNTSRHRSEVREVRTREGVTHIVSKICFDFTETDKEFLTNEICGKLKTISSRGRSYHVLTAGLIYLLSKCPANSDRPLQYKEVYQRYCKCDPHYRASAFYDAIAFLKSIGVESCKITAEMVIRSHQNELATIINMLGADTSKLASIMNSAIEIVNDPKIRKETIGKNPFVMATAAMYMSRDGIPIAQKEFGEIFNVTEVSIRNTIRRIKEIRGEIEPRVIG